MIPSQAEEQTNSISYKLRHETNEIVFGRSCTCAIFGQHVYSLIFMTLNDLVNAHMLNAYCLLDKIANVCLALKTPKKWRARTKEQQSSMQDISIGLNE